MYGLEETISLKDIFNIIKKRLFLIVSLTMLGAIIAGVVSYFVLTPVYQASTQILVNKQDTEKDIIGEQDIRANLQLINTYNVIINSPFILEKVIENLDLNVTSSELSEQISISNAEDSQVIEISVKDEQHFRAVDIANMIAEVFQQEVPALMNISKGNVNILSPATHLDSPGHVSPNEKMNIAIAAVIGLMVGVGLAFLLEYLDTTVKSEADVEELLGLPIIGIVSVIPEELPSSANKEPREAVNRSRRGKFV